MNKNKEQSQRKAKAMNRMCNKNFGDANVGGTEWRDAFIDRQKQKNQITMLRNAGLQALRQCYFIYEEGDLCNINVLPYVLGVIITTCSRYTVKK